jgi:putative oxidoreductase
MILKELFFSQKKIWVDFSLLILRVFMGGTFLVYAIKKVENFESYVTLFSDKLDLPLPLLNLYLVIGFEGIGGLLLVFGFLTRMVSIPLIVTMLMAMFLVNISNGFAASSFGVEINLAYISILLILFSHGAGKYSLDERMFVPKG